jgi:CubicO group peptidase (beta-lactamase class C family)
VPHRARGYLPVADGWRNAGYVAPMTNTTADGSMLLNLHDMIAWNDVVANRRILSEPSWDLILNPMTLNSGRSYPYGFGWFLEEAGGQTVQQHGGNWQGFSTQFTRFIGDDLAVIVLANARSFDVAGLPNTIGALLNPSLERAPPPSTPIADPDPEATEYVRGMLAKIARGELVLDDFAFLRQTVFPRIRAALTAQLQGMGEPDRMELLDRQPVGDDVSLQYWAWYGAQRFRVLVSLGPEGGLTSLRLIPEAP